MIPAEWLEGEVAVAGLGSSGRSAATLLAQQGAKVYASDQGSDPATADQLSALKDLGVDVQVGGHDLARVAGASFLVASPGIPPEAPVLTTARSSGVKVISEVELGLRFLPEARIIAVTGTNGKTTTTAMIGHLLRTMGYGAVDAGNIGVPVCEVALMETPPTWLALELSSFQLHDTPSIKPAVGVLTNLSADHLDRYPSVVEYFADKALLFSNAAQESRWVVNLDDDDSLAMVSGAVGSIHHFALNRSGADAWYNRDTGFLVVHGRDLLSRDEFPLLGDHNVANALAAALAIAVADPVHESHEMWNRMADGLRTFRSLPHRVEPVSESGGVLWINDSKATNVSSTLVAVRAMSRPYVLLLGGKHKGESYAALAEDIAKGCTLVICYGAAAPIIERDLRGAAPLRVMGSSFGEVIDAARAAAKPGDAILLSPACSSYDMFNNYRERGDLFRALSQGK